MRSFSGHREIKHFELHHMWDVKYILRLLFPESLDCKGEAEHILSPFHHCREVEQHSDTEHIEVGIDRGNLVDTLVGKPVVEHELLCGLW